MPSATKASLARYSRPSDTQAAADAIPILVDGEYHVFHLTTPPNTVRHPPRLRSTWSRLRSRDLISWQRDEIEALYPGKNLNSPDANGAWTGSAVIGPDGNMHLFYTGYNLSLGGKQVILHARSSDRSGSTFTKSPSPIRISGDMSQFEDIDFRDAHVSWNEPEGCFWMLVATRLRTGPYWTRGCLALLTSSDLEEWTVDPDSFYAPNDMLCPECPEIFSLPNGKWYLVYSRFHAPDAGTIYKIADAPRGPFRTPRDGSGGRFDARRWYAAKSCPKAGDPTKRIYFGWVADRLEGQWSWGGDMGMPREVSANEAGHLVVAPSAEFLETTMFSAIDASLVPSRLRIDSVGTTSSHFFPIELADYHLKLRVESQDAASFGILFRADEDMQGHRLRFVPVSSTRFAMSLLKCPAPLDDFWADQYDLHLPREADGPEIARHSVVDIKDGVMVTLRSDVLEIFVGGKSISYRLPRGSSASGNGQHAITNGHPNGTANGTLQNGVSPESVRELGVFVEDGALELTDIILTSGGI